MLPPFVGGDIRVTKLTNIHPVFNNPRYWIQVFLNAITSLAIISDMTGWCDCSEVDSLNWICKFWGHFLYKGFPKTDFTGYLKVNLIFLKKDKKSTFFVFRLCDPLDPLTVLHLQTFSLVYLSFIYLLLGTWWLSLWVILAVNVNSPRRTMIPTRR